MANARNHIIAGMVCLTLSGVACNEESTLHPVRKNITEAVYASGEIVPENEHWLSSMRSGKLLRKMVNDGDTVKRGQLLFVIGDETAQKNVDAARANFALSAVNLSNTSPVLADAMAALAAANAKFIMDSSDYARWNNLWQHDIGTKSNLNNLYTQFTISANERDAAEQRYRAKLNELRVAQKTAATGLANAQKSLEDLYILSDRDGVVYETSKKEGESVNINERVVSIGDSHDRTIDLYVDQQDITKIKIGQKVLVQTDATGNAVFEALITFIYPAMNKSDQTFTIKAKFIQSPDFVFVHSPVEANIIIGQKKNVLVLPKDVLSGKDSVWIREKEGARKIAITTGVTSFDYVEVLHGVDETSAVIPNGYNRK